MRLKPDFIATHEIRQLKQTAIKFNKVEIDT